MLRTKALVAAAALSITALTLGACGPATVQLRPGNSCDSSPDGLKICRDQCDANEARACYRIGWFYETGQEVSENISTAVQHYAKACDLNFAVACRALGQMYWSGDQVKRDAKKGIAFLRKACTLGVPEACPTMAMVARSEGRRPAPGDDRAVETAAGYAPNTPNTPDGPDAPKINGPQAPEVQSPNAPTIDVSAPSLP